jgi:hypothetical protein
LRSPSSEPSNPQNDPFADFNRYIKNELLQRVAEILRVTLPEEGDLNYREYQLEDLNCSTYFKTFTEDDAGEKMFYGGHYARSLSFEMETAPRQDDWTSDADIRFELEELKQRAVTSKTFVLTKSAPLCVVSHRFYVAPCTLSRRKKEDGGVETRFNIEYMRSIDGTQEMFFGIQLNNNTIVTLENGNVTIERRKELEVQILDQTYKISTHIESEAEQKAADDVKLRIESALYAIALIECADVMDYSNYPFNYHVMEAEDGHDFVVLNPEVVRGQFAAIMAEVFKKNGLFLDFTGFIDDTHEHSDSTFMRINPQAGPVLVAWNYHNPNLLRPALQPSQQ